MRRRTGTLVPIAGLVLTFLLTGCSEDDSSSDDEHGHGHSQTHGSEEPSGDDEQFTLPASAPDAPASEALAKRGFDCGDVSVEYPVDEQESFQLCILSDGVVSASWTMRIYRGKVIGWNYFAWPMDSGPSNTVTLRQAKALQSVFHTLLPQDFRVLGPALKEWTTPKDTRTWAFDGVQHAGTTGTGTMAFSATLKHLPDAIGAMQPATATGPELDGETFVEAARSAGWSKCTGEDRGDMWGYEVMCDVGDIFAVSLDINTEGLLYGLSVTHFGSDDGPRLLKELTAIAADSGSEEFATWTKRLAKQASRGTKTRYEWVGRIPALIQPVRHADGLKLDVGTLLEPE